MVEEVTPVTVTEEGGADGAVRGTYTFKTNNNGNLLSASRVTPFAGLLTSLQPAALDAVTLMEYSKTSLSGHSEKRTHSLQRTMWQSRIENPVYVIH